MEDGGEVGEVGRFEEGGDGFEGFLVVGEIGEVDDREFVGGELDDEVGEAAGAAGVEEKLGGGCADKPASGVVCLWFDGEAEAAEGGGEGE